MDQTLRDLYTRFWTGSEASKYSAFLAGMAVAFCGARGEHAQWGSKPCAQDFTASSTQGGEGHSGTHDIPWQALRRQLLTITH